MCRTPTVTEIKRFPINKYKNAAGQFRELIDSSFFLSGLLVFVFVLIFSSIKFKVRLCCDCWRLVEVTSQTFWLTGPKARRDWDPGDDSETILWKYISKFYDTANLARPPARTLRTPTNVSTHFGDSNAKCCLQDVANSCSPVRCVLP